MSREDTYRQALERILEEPRETLSDAKALREIVRVAKAALKSPAPTPPGQREDVAASAAGQDIDQEALEVARSIMSIVNGSWLPGGACQVQAKIQCEIVNLLLEKRAEGVRAFNQAMGNDTHLGEPVIRDATAPAPSQPSSVATDAHFTAINIVQEEAGRMLSRKDFDLCLRIAKRALLSRPSTERDSVEREAKKRRLQAYPTLSQFFEKHGIGSITKTSCFKCGHVGEPAITHLELPNIYICKCCATLSADAADRVDATKPKKSLSASVADALRPFLQEGQKVIWREPFRWHDDDGVMSNHYEMFSPAALAADFNYTIVDDCGCAAIIECAAISRMRSEGSTT